MISIYICVAFAKAQTLKSVFMLMKLSNQPMPARRLAMIAYDLNLLVLNICSWRN